MEVQLREVKPSEYQITHSFTSEKGQKGGIALCGSCPATAVETVDEKRWKLMKDMGNKESEVGQTKGSSVPIISDV